MCIELRDQKKSRDFDTKNKCFICNIDRYVFDRYAEGFEHHIEQDHNLWNYLFYILYLKSKDPTEFTGVESYVFEQVLFLLRRWTRLV